MASLRLGAASLINEVVFGSSLIGIRSKRFRRVSERWRFRVQQMSVKEQELARSAKRLESLKRILELYGVSVENSEDNKMNSRFDDLSCEDKDDLLPSSVVDDSTVNITEELPDISIPEKYSETVSTAENLNHHNLPQLRTGVSFTSLLPVFGICIVCIIVTLHTIMSRKRSQGYYHGSKSTRWRTALSDLNEPLASDEHDSSSEFRVSSAKQETSDESNDAYSRVELEYKRFLLDCGVSES